MQESSTIWGIVEMRLKGISYDDCRSRYGVGNSTVSLITERYDLRPRTYAEYQNQ